MEQLEQNQNVEEKKDNKLSSRKFIVWVTWLIITIITLIIVTVAMCITKETNSAMVSIIENVLTYLFFISLTYLGVNFGQKIGLAYCDKKIKIDTKEEENAKE